MTSRFATGFAAFLMFLAFSAGMPSAEAQTSLGWGQHVSRYGSGYVGNAPNTIPATTFYRGPALAPYNTQAAYGQPVQAYYAPAATTAPVGVTPSYSPGVSYRLGTPNAATYTTAYSPIVTPTTL